MTEPVLDIRDLSVAFAAGRQTVLDRVSFAVGRGEIVALVGESGSGKSISALAVMGLLPPGAAVTVGDMRFAGGDLQALDGRARRNLRGPGMGMIFQDPMTSLNPVLTIGRQLTEALVSHRLLQPARAQARAAQMLERVGIDRPAERLRQYPHEFSGGMRQRVMIAAAMALEPRLLIADEPTTALDVTVQAQILELLRTLVREAGTSLLLITHDMGVVAEMADRVVVLRAGRIVETAGVEHLFARPEKPYTRALLDAVPRIDGISIAPAPPDAPAPVLRLDRIVKAFRQSGVVKRALDRVTLELAAGETLALVGESGSGKSTLGRAATRLIEVDEGTILLDGDDLGAMRGRALRRARAKIQVVFQDPYASLDPRLTVGRSVAEPMLIHGRARGAATRQAATALLDRVGLDRTFADRFPHELSGGQRQRVAIARALAAAPSVIVADEPTSALDVSVQAQILDLLVGLQRDSGLGYLFITHDLSVVRRIAHRIAVMHAGRIVEVGPADDLLVRPAHPYTQALLAAAPVPDPGRRTGRIPVRPWSGESGPLVPHGQDWWVAA